MKKISVFVLFLFLCSTLAFSAELRKAPQFELRKVSFGDTSLVSLSSYKGRIVLLIFLARWDIASVNQVPIINRVAGQYNEVTALAINSSLDADNNLTRFEKQMNISFPLLASDGVVTQRYGVGNNLPVVVIITAEDQNIYKKYTGNVSAEKLQKDIDALLVEEKDKRESEKLEEKDQDQEDEAEEDQLSEHSSDQEESIW